MKNGTGIGVGVLMAALVVGGAYGPATAQDKGKDTKATAKSAPESKATRTVLAENDKMIVFEVRQKPGEVNTPNSSATRVVRALQGSTTLRTFADGKTETKEWKTGEVQIQTPGPAYSTKNIGKTDFVVYVVLMKDAPATAPAKK